VIFSSLSVLPFSETSSYSQVPAFLTSIVDRSEVKSA
jgi:hypothetical protein